MLTVTEGTLAGLGTFGCDTCGFRVALREQDAVPACPRCHNGRFRRSSLFENDAGREPGLIEGSERPEWFDRVRAELSSPHPHLAYEDELGAVEVVALEEEWMRIGRSPAAQLHFDDPTVSRRHALIHRHPGGVRVLDDRSLNGVWVNGRRVEQHELEDGDELTLGRFRIFVLVAAGTGARAAD